VGLEQAPAPNANHTHRNKLPHLHLRADRILAVPPTLPLDRADRAHAPTLLSFGRSRSGCNGQFGPDLANC